MESFRPKSRVKEQRRILLKRRLIVAGISVVVLFGGLAGLSYAPFWKLNTVSVSGNTVTESRDIENAVLAHLYGSYGYIFARANAVIYPHDAILASLERQFPRLETIDVSRNGFHQIVVKVTERKGEYLWCAGTPALLSNETPCLFVDGHGYIFSSAPYFSGTVYFRFFGFGENFVPGQALLDETIFTRLLGFRDFVAGLSYPSYALESLGDNDYALYLLNEHGTSTPKILFTARRGLDKGASDLESALSDETFAKKMKAEFQNLEYLDVRYENKVYYKFK